MKAFVFACALAALVVIAACVTEEQKIILKKNHKICLEETKADKAKVTKLHKNKDFSDKDEALQAFVFCMFTKSDIITPEGKLNKAVALSKVGVAFDACSGIQGKTPQESAYLIAECYFQEKSAVA